MVVHAYSPNTQEAGGKGSGKIAKFPGMATHHFPRCGCAWGENGGKKETSWWWRGAQTAHGIQQAWMAGALVFFLLF